MVNLYITKEGLATESFQSKSSVEEASKYWNDIIKNISHVCVHIIC